MRTEGAPYSRTGRVERPTLVVSSTAPNQLWQDVAHSVSLGPGKVRTFSQGLGLRSAEGRVPGRRRSRGKDPYTVERTTSDATSGVSPGDPGQSWPALVPLTSACGVPGRREPWFQVWLPRSAENEESQAMRVVEAPILCEEGDN